jgi:hypothetical protein
MNLKYLVLGAASLAAAALTGCAGHGGDENVSTGAGSALSGSGETVNRVHCAVDLYSVRDIPAQYMPFGEDTFGIDPSASLGRFDNIHTSQFDVLVDQFGGTSLGVGIALGPKVVLQSFYHLDSSLDVELFYEDMAPFTKDGKTYDAARVVCKAQS